jgi:hypothetical protein
VKRIPWSPDTSVRWGLAVQGTLAILADPAEVCSPNHHPPARGYPINRPPILPNLTSSHARPPAQRPQLGSYPNTAPARIETSSRRAEERRGAGAEKGIPLRIPSSSTAAKPSRAPPRARDAERERRPLSARRTPHSHSRREGKP